MTTAADVPSRLMGDAIHDQVPELAGLVGFGLQVVAGYVTGSPDIVWTGADWQRFGGLPRVTIDQGFTGAPQYGATVIDVETGAWAPGSVGGWMDHATAPRPTIYVNQGNEQAACASGLLSKRFRGDVWLAFPGWRPGNALPPLPAGCRYVAIQNQLDVAGAYDLSLVLDPYWPGAAMERILTIDRATVPAGVNWPGSWLLQGDGSVQWLSAPRYQALIAAGVLEVPNYPYANWQALAGVQ